GPHGAADRRILGPIHRADIELGAAIEAFETFARQRHPCFGRQHGLERHDFGGFVDTRAMQIEIGHHALESARAVEYRGAQPGCMGPNPHDRQVALVPIVLEKCQRFRPGDGAAHRSILSEALLSHGLRLVTITMARRYIWLALTYSTPMAPCLMCTPQLRV